MLDDEATAYEEWRGCARELLTLTLALKPLQAAVQECMADHTIALESLGPEARHLAVDKLNHAVDARAPMRSAWAAAQAKFQAALQRLVNVAAQGPERE